MPVKIAATVHPAAAMTVQGDEPGRRAPAFLCALAVAVLQAALDDLTPRLFGVVLSKPPN
jgi:hypothetical protein